METTILYTLNKSTIEFDPSVPCVIARYAGFTTSREFRIFQDKILEWMIKKKKVHEKMSWLVDGEVDHTVTDQDMKWIVSDWNIRTLEAGIVHNAVIVAEGDNVNIGMENYRNNYVPNMGRHLTTHYFQYEEHAKAWLRAVLKQEEYRVKDDR